MKFTVTPGARRTKDTCNSAVDRITKCMLACFTVFGPDLFLHIYVFVVRLMYIHIFF